MLFFEQPPPDWDDASKAYINRLMYYISEAVDSTNGVSIRKEVPEKPREGKIYYLKEDLDDKVTEGYYVFVNGVWEKLAYETKPWT